MKEKMSDEQLREANETILMMDEDFRMKLSGVSWLSQDWELRVHLIQQELIKSQEAHQACDSELQIKATLSEKLSEEVAAQQKLVQQLNEKLAAVQQQAQQVESGLIEKHQETVSALDADKRKLTTDFQDKLAALTAEHAASSE